MSICLNIWISNLLIISIQIPPQEDVRKLQALLKQSEDTFNSQKDDLIAKVPIEYIHREKRERKRGKSKFFFACRYMLLIGKSVHDAYKFLLILQGLNNTVFNVTDIVKNGIQQAKNVSRCIS